ncbi:MULTISPECIES: glycosyltransferase family 4 protein [unclassified Pseudoalteromonas]|uniref:glycosyltransferase family 4 protein n=1 Tax=unclassified Pseudoalteromonas TaxID=194690 RepID=UPI001107F894|nr:MULTISPECIES: glycosyltransferase family 4 protein [unclassified Pseudoalteromonas]TMN77034.1 glycosyltransferase WbuB [Pseudoalteromonas sp. S410]TMN87485.1 glycosyltransferase WbuB [Pseudoalteromonas sp. S408]TMN94514.1 glycosyltransferase WbuB [Pseudoalteromonas sp. S407]TMO01740.1 glycosyltransferase WbuB [Pseudoalteromonas sp. S409]TMO10889.1 glycosyltransferase WbuB [Pseudoalteromonas sp. S186]
MKVLVLSFYYAPDLCAGSFRTTALIEQLKNNSDVEIEVITTMPNRYASFEAGAQEFEQNDNVTVRRIVLPSHKSGMLDQIKSFAAFYKQVNKLVSGKKYDLVFATSSRLFTAFLGARIAKRVNAPLYLDIRDIFVDTLKDVLNLKITFLLKPILTLVENYTFSAAKHINLVSKGFESYFVNRFKSANYSWFTNGIDKEFLLTEVPLKSELSAPDTLTVLYAGNIGEGQGLNTILPELAKLVGVKYQFKVIGDGGRKAALVEASKGVTNISFHPPVNREQLIQEYLSADILFLHLNDYPAFEKVLPSKIFEYAAMGKPILAGVGGYAAQFINKEVANAEVFYPSNHQQAITSLDSLKLGQTNRDSFINKYTRTNIMNEMANSIISCGGKK